MLTVDIQVAVEEPDGLPVDAYFVEWSQAAYQLGEGQACVTIRIVSLQESHQLNKQYRHQDKPTNVLSFPMEMPDGFDVSILGDIAICAEIVQQEAKQQEKNVLAHWAHMTVHGILHLQGYDHIEEVDANEMEALEVEIMSSLGFANPYELASG